MQKRLMCMKVFICCIIVFQKFWRISVFKIRDIFLVFYFFLWRFLVGLLSVTYRSGSAVGLCLNILSVPISNCKAQVILVPQGSHMLELQDCDFIPSTYILIRHRI